MKACYSHTCSGRKKNFNVQHVYAYLISRKLYIMCFFNISHVPFETHCASSGSSLSNKSISENAFSYLYVPESQCKFWCLYHQYAQCCTFVSLSQPAIEKQTGKTQEKQISFREYFYGATYSIGRARWICDVPFFRSRSFFSLFSLCSRTCSVGVRF